MKKAFLKSRAAILATIALLGCILGLPTRSHAQVCSPPPTAIAGNNTVYEICSSTATAIPSSAYVDVQAFDPATTDDICTKNKNVLSASSTAAGTVLDARGALPGSGPTQSCGTNPFSGITKTSIVLLPP